MKLQSYPSPPISGTCDRLDNVNLPNRSGGYRHPDLQQFMDSIVEKAIKAPADGVKDAPAHSTNSSLADLPYGMRSLS